jgi:hypothetical protein
LEKIAGSRVGQCNSIVEELFKREAWAEEALDATQDLSGLVLCDAKPAGWMRDAGEPSISTMAHCIPTPVKDIWIKVNPKNVERYTIPLHVRKQP